MTDPTRRTVSRNLWLHIAIVLAIVASPTSVEPSRVEDEFLA